MIAIPCEVARPLPAAFRCRRRLARSIRRTSRPIRTPASAGGRRQPSGARCGPGVDRAGQHLYPTFPYDHFTNVTDEDDRALYAFLMTRPAVNAPARANDLSFPLNQRFVVAGWKLLFLRRETYQPDATQSAEWNRGAYLVEGLAHCGACHTPRNALGAERASASFSGGDVDNWQAYAINARSPSPVPWDANALFGYLRQGWHPDHGVARGPMAEVVSNLSSVQESDVHAIAAYMASVFGPPTQDRLRQASDVRAQIKSSAAAICPRPTPPVHRSTPLPARLVMTPTGRCPMAGSISVSAPPSALPIRATPPTLSSRAFAPWRESAARSCRGLPAA